MQPSSRTLSTSELLKLSPSALIKHLGDGGAPQNLSSLSQVGIDALRKRATASLSPYRAIVTHWYAHLLLLAVITAVLVTTGVLPSLSSHSVSGVTSVDVTVYIGALALWCFFMLVSSMGARSKHEDVEYMLRPLGYQTRGCHDALELISENPVCAAYRRAVLASGRKFTQADLTMLYLLISKETVTQVRAEREEACIKLNSSAA